MYTYQDFEEIQNNDRDRMEFVRSVIADHEKSELYKNAVLAKEYDRRRNRTILQYQKFLRTASGKTVPDNYSANYKIPSNFFDFFVVQECQYLLGNGVSWKEDSTGEKLGKNFDKQLQKLGKKALVEGQAFGFWNYDHLDVFGVSEFCPLYDEENGALMAGVRFWRIDPKKPLRATLYELDGCTDYIWRDSGGEVLNAKRRYVTTTTSTAVDGTEIFGDGENYPSFPIVPMWGSDKKQSEIVGLQERIDSYDLVESGFANDLDDVAQIYWILKNAGGMGEAELVEFLKQIHRTRAAVLDDGVEAQPHTTDIPYAARETLLTRLREDLFEQAMAFDPKKIASGGSVVTAAIKAAFAPLDSKCDEFETHVQDFLQGILSLVGIEDETPTFTRSVLINQSEQIGTLLSAAQYLPQSYVTEKILTTLGDGDRFEDIQKEIEAQMLERMSGMGTGEEGGDGGDGGKVGDSGEGDGEGEGEPKKKKKAPGSGKTGGSGGTPGDDGGV